MKQTIYVFSDGELKRNNNTLYFDSGDNKKYMPIENIGELMIFGEVAVGKRLLEFVSKNEILLHFFNYYGYYVGTFYPREHYNSGHMILKQSEYYLDLSKRLSLAKKFVTGAINNITRVMTYYESRGKNLESYIQYIKGFKEKIESVSDIDTLMSYEGNARNYYYKSFNEIIDSDLFRYKERTRRPPETMLDALISFGNTLLYTTVLSEIYKTHLDPRIGYLHSTNFRSFTLNLDVSEIFKPIIVDRTIFSLLNKNILKPSDFMKELNGIYLNEKGKKIFVQEYQNKLETTIRHKKLNRDVSYKTLILLELYKIEKHLMNDEEYEPYEAGW
jgi:CRISPR-associated protein Cas1